VASSKKRGRKSVDKAETPDKPAKKVKSDEEPPKKKDGRGRKKKSEVNPAVEMMDIEATQKDGWEPPKALPGAWEEGVVSVHTIEGTDDGTKWAYLCWADEGEDGKKRQTKAKLSTCYVACPQMVCTATPKLAQYDSDRLNRCSNSLNRICMSIHKPIV